MDRNRKSEDLDGMSKSADDSREDVVNDALENDALENDALGTVDTADSTGLDPEPGLEPGTETGTNTDIERDNTEQSSDQADGVA